MPWKRRAFAMPGTCDVLVVDIDHRDRRAEPRHTPDRQRMGFRSDVERLPKFFGFGCGGGAPAFARGATCTRSSRRSNVLFLTIDLSRSACASTIAEYRDVRVGRAVRRWRRGGRLRAAPKRPALSGQPARIFASGGVRRAAPNASWAGTSSMSVLAWCCRHSCRRWCRTIGAARCGLSGQEPRANGGVFRRLPVSSGRAKGTGNSARRAWPGRTRPQAFVERAARLRQHVFRKRMCFVLDEAIGKAPRAATCWRPQLDRASPPISRSLSYEPWAG